MKAETPTTQPRLVIIACALTALVLAGGCDKKEEKAPAASQPQPTRAINLIDETKRNAEALKAQSTGAGAAALPYSQLPGLLDQLASHMEARTQARQQGADTSQADAQVASDVTQLEAIQNTIAVSQPEGDKKPALDRLSENLTKVIQVVRQGQELKATLKPTQGEGGIQPGAGMNEYASQNSFTQSNDTAVAAAGESTPASNEVVPSTETASSENTVPDSTGGAESEMKAKSRDKLTLAAAKLPAGKMAAASSASACCTVVPNPTMKGRLGRLVVTFPEGTKVSARVGVSKGGKEATYGHGNQAFELFPGSYTVVISGKRVDNVTVQSGHDTKVKVGVLRVTAPGGTRMGILDKDRKTEITYGHGSQEFGLPIGTVYVSVAGQSEAVTIQEGKITDF
jgi:hypothetical protein